MKRNGVAETDDQHTESPNYAIQDCFHVPINAIVSIAAHRERLGCGEAVAPVRPPLHYPPPLHQNARLGDRNAFFIEKTLTRLDRMKQTRQKEQLG